jgi:hypothetical protein
MYSNVEMPGRWITGLGPGDVESDDALVAEPDRQLGDLTERGRDASR